MNDYSDLSIVLFTVFVFFLVKHKNYIYLVVTVLQILPIFKSSQTFVALHFTTCLIFILLAFRKAAEIGHLKHWHITVYKCIFAITKYEITVTLYTVKIYNTREFGASIIKANLSCIVSHSCFSGASLCFSRIYFSSRVTCCLAAVVLVFLVAFSETYGVCHLELPGCK